MTLRVEAGHNASKMRKPASKKQVAGLKLDTICLERENRCASGTIRHKFPTMFFIITLTLLSFALFAVSGPQEYDWSDLKDEIAGFDGSVLILETRSGRVLFKHESDKVRSADKGFPPGSTIKPFTVLAAFDKFGSEARIMTFGCKPSKPTVPVAKSCWYRPGHGTLNLPQAIAHSCDSYFRQMSSLVEPKAFLSIARDFDLDVDRTLTRMSVDKLRLAMIGLEPTHKALPIRLADAYSALYNGGYLFSRGKSFAPIMKRKLDLNRVAVYTLTEGMRLCSTEGTAMEAQKLAGDVKLFSKTGTSMYTEGESVDPLRTHGWFVGIFDLNEKSYTVQVFALEGTGASTASPMAGKVIAKAVKALDKGKKP